MEKILGRAGIVWPQQWQQLAVMIDAGLSIEVALKTLQGTIKEIDSDLAKVIRLVQRGGRLSDAFLQTRVVNINEEVIGFNESSPLRAHYGCQS